MCGGSRHYLLQVEHCAFIHMVRIKGFVSLVEEIGYCGCLVGCWTEVVLYTLFGPEP